MSTVSFPFKAFAFEGGGTTAFGHQGAIEVFEEYNIIPQIKYFIGSSSGAFLAAGLGCGASAKQMHKLLNETDFLRFLDDSPGICRDTYRLLVKYGWNRGDYVKEWYGTMLSKIIGDSEITFEQAYKKTGNMIVLTTVDLTTGEMVYMSYLTTPDLMIKEGVRRSSALPLFFKPITVSENIPILDNGVVRMQQIERCYVDGGLLDNYPVTFFDQYLDKPEETVGFRLTTSVELDEKTNPYVDPTKPSYPRNLKDFMLRSFIMMINKNYKVHVSQKDWERTVKIDTENYSFVNFHYTQSEKDFLVNQGRIGAKQFIEDYIEKIKG